MARWGVYCLANDAVLDWTLAFLESLRAYNPSTGLVVIPFDDRVDRLGALASTYDFALLDLPELFNALDGIGRAIYPTAHRGEKMFRKFAAFYGPFEHFLFLDADIVVLLALEPLMRRLVEGCADFIFFDTAPGWVYADPVFRQTMQREHGSRLFSNGAFVSRRGFIGVDELSAACDERDRLKQVFPQWVYDQPYMNYVVDMKGAKLAASYDIAPELFPGIWAAGPVDVSASQLRRLGASQVTRDGKTLPFLHWAGFRCDYRMPNLDFFLHFRLQAAQSWMERMRCRYRFRQRGRPRAAAASTGSPKP